MINLNARRSNTKYLINCIYFIFGHIEIKLMFVVSQECAQWTKKSQKTSFEQDESVFKKIGVHWYARYSVICSGCLHNITTCSHYLFYTYNFLFILRLQLNENFACHSPRFWMSNFVSLYLCFSRYRKLTFLQISLVSCNI